MNFSQHIWLVLPYGNGVRISNDDLVCWSGSAMNGIRSLGSHRLIVFTLNATNLYVHSLKPTSSATLPWTSGNIIASQIAA